MADRQPRLSHQTLKVLRLFCDAPREERAGSAIARSTGLGSGTLYPILDRLESAGWLTSSWEVGEPSALGRPRRRLYTITALGQQQAVSALNELLGAPAGGASWAH